MADRRVNNGGRGAGAGRKPTRPECVDDAALARLQAAFARAEAPEMQSRTIIGQRAMMLESYTSVDAFEGFIHQHKLLRVVPASASLLKLGSDFFGLPVFAPAAPLNLMHVLAAAPPPPPVSLLSHHSGASAAAKPSRGGGRQQR